MNAARRRRCRTSAGAISYVDAGAGPAVVLLHGFPASSHLWRREVPMFASRMRVIAPDLLGYGESDKRADAELSIGAQARYVRDLLGGLSLERVAIVGHGIGGGVAQLLAATGIVETLVLVDTVAFDGGTDHGTSMVPAAKPGRVTTQDAEHAVRSAFAAGIEHTGGLSEADLAAFLTPWRSDPAALVRAGNALSGAGLDGVVERVSARAIPVMVLWGEDDAVYPVASAEWFLDRIPAAIVAVLPGCGHFVTEDAPGTVGPLILEFLRRRYLGDGQAYAAAPAPEKVFLERPPRWLDDPADTEGG